MSTEAYRWHYDYTRIAWDSGFTFDSQKSQKAFDRNGIALIDIDRIIRERDIALVELHIQNVLEYKLDVEEMRILDPNFVKLFRLSQLGVEYLTYCKKYLDSTVVTLKKDLQASAEENEDLKQELNSHQSEINKLKKRIKDLKTTLHVYQKYRPVGTTINEPVAIFQCNECNKAFVNEEYLKAHMTRRHHTDLITSEIRSELKISELPASSEFPMNTTPVHTQYKEETDRLQMEIKELKEKLNSTEKYFKNEEKKVNNSPEHGVVKIHTTNSQSEEYYKHIEKLHSQFESLKTQIESEMLVLKAQNTEHDKYEKLIEKVFEKLETKTQQKPEERIVARVENIDKHVENKEIQSNLSLETEIKPSNERRNSYTQTDIEDLKQTEISANSNVSVPKSSEMEQIEMGSSLLQKQKQSIVKASVSNELPETPVQVATPSPQKRKIAPRLIDDTSRFIKVTNSPTMSDISIPDIAAVREEVEKKLEKKTKEDIDKLGEQLSEQMSDTFLKLQSRMETFWNKLQEIEIQREKHIQKMKAEEEQKILEEEQRRRLEQKTSTTPKVIEEILSVRNNNLYSSETDSDSETESNRYQPNNVDIEKRTQINQIPVKSNKIIKTHIPEKPKGQEKKIIVPKDINKDRKTTDVAKSFVQKPVVQTVFSKRIKESSSESESETTESESETETPVNIKPSKTRTEGGRSITPTYNTKPSKTTTDGGKSTNTGLSTLQNRSIKSLENALITNPEILETFRGEMQEVVSDRLRDLGVDPEWTKLPDKAYKQKTDIAAHHRNLASKNIKSFTEIRNYILEQLEEKVSNLQHAEAKSPILEDEPKTSKFKSLLSNMKNKAKSIIKSEKSEKSSEKSPTTGIYRLTIHRDVPQTKRHEQSKSVIKTQTTLNRSKNKPRIKQIVKQKMYESESESEPIEKNIESRQKKIEPPKPIIKAQVSKSVKSKEIPKQKMYETDTENDSENVSDHRKYVQVKISPPKPLPRKSRSESSIDTIDISEEIQKKSESVPLKNMARSLSNLDSIIEMKKELTAELNQELAARKLKKDSISESEQSNKEELIVVSAKNQNESENKDVIAKAIENEKNQLELSSSDAENEDKDEKMHKGVLKNFPSTGSFVKKKVIFDLHSDSIKSISSDNKEVPENKNQIPSKNIPKSNSFFQAGDKNLGNDSSTSVDSSILELDGSKSKQKSKAGGDKISTKALINVSTKNSKLQDDVSDWDISDIIN